MAGSVAVNDAGDVMVLGPGGQWQPARLAEDGRGNRLFFDGTDWRPVPTPATPLRSIAQGATDPIHGGAQLLTHALPTGVVDAVNDATAWVNRQPVIGPVTRALGMTPATPQQIDDLVRRREESYQADRRAAGQAGTDWWRIAGQTGVSLPAMAALPAGSGLIGAATAGAATGAASSALAPVAEPGADFWEAKRDQAVAGGVIGAVTGPAAHLLGRTIAPRVDPAVRTLREAGVELTPGQAAGGIARRIEDKATSLPLVGDAITGAQRRALESFNRAVANRVLKPIGQSVPDDAPVGRELVQLVSDRISRAYDDAIAEARPFGPDARFAADLQQIGARFLTPGGRQTFARALQEHVVSRFQNGPLDGATYQTVKSELGRLAASYRGSSIAAEREVGEAFQAVQRAMQDLLARTNPQVAGRLRAADAAYAGFVRMSDAASRVGATEGVFTPAQFTAAVRAGDRSLRHGTYARGGAQMQDLSDAARAVLPNSVPNSGTTDRLLNAMLLGGAASGAVPPHLLAVGPVAQALYSRPATNALTALLAARRPVPVELLGSGVARSGGPLALPFGSLLLSPVQEGPNELP